MHNIDGKRSTTSPGGVHMEAALAWGDKVKSPPPAITLARRILLNFISGFSGLFRKLFHVFLMLKLSST